MELYGQDFELGADLGFSLVQCKPRCLNIEQCNNVFRLD